MTPTVKKYLAAGEAIFKEGDSGDSAYIIENGRVEISLTSAGDNFVLTNLGVGELLGEMSVIDGSPRSATATAIEPCELIVISREALAERFDSADTIVRFLISMLLKRMRSSNKNQISKQTSTTKPQPGKDSQLITADDPEAYANQQAAVLERLHFEADLKQAVASKELVLNYQPIIELKTRRIAGFEALVRWPSPKRGLVRPDKFIGLAEETSLIVPIGKWITERALEDFAHLLKVWEGLGEEKPIFMSINVSGKQFKDPNFFDHLTQTTDRLKLDPSMIKLEVTERILIEGVEAETQISHARKLGFRVALDDFGTGFSSLGYLAKFAVDTLKVDQSFVRKILSDDRMLVITRAIVHMSNGLNIPVVAEGIENPDEAAALLAMGCEYGQGFMYAKALPLEKAVGVVERKTFHGTSEENEREVHGQDAQAEAPKSA